jgi:hypothetical protein
VTCHDTEEAMLDVLLGGSTVEARAALATHLMSCDECRSRERALRNTWDALGSLTAPGPRPAVVERVRQTMVVATRPSQSMRIPRMSIRTRSLVQSLGAAALGALLTFVVVGRSAQVAQAADTDPRPHFMLLIVDDLAAPAPSSTELRQELAAHRAWAQRLQADGRLVSADKLTDDDGRSVPAAPTTSAVSATPTERIGGFYIIRARDYDEAVHIANDNPTLKYGGRVQVRMIDKV